MKISRLPDRLDRMPMLKILVFFAAGIALADRYELPLWFLAGAFVVTGVLALSLRSSAATAAMILTAGFAAAQFRAPRATVPRGVHTVYEVTVEGFPADRGRYAVADASVAAWRDPADGRWHASDARIRLYADSLAGLHAGERIRCRGAVRPFRGGAESYRRLMARRGYAGTLWIAERTLLERLPGRHAGLHRRAVERLSRLPMSAGAAAMCTVLQAALASASEYVGLNALAAAGFGMLVWNPSWLGDISFQLSFVAVAAILAWGVPLCRRCRTRWKGVNVVVDAYLIGFVATVATAPLVSHTFGVVPLAGLAVNPLAIALAGVVVFGGALWMLAPVGFLAPAFGFVTGSAAEGISALARLTASLPGGAADYTLGGWPTAAVYAVFALATLAAWSGEPKKNVSLRT